MSFEQMKAFKVAPSLRRKIQIEGGRTGQKVIISKRNGITIKRLLEALENHKISISPTPDHTDHYLFETMLPADIGRAVELDEVDQIWPDDEGHALLDESVETIKAKAIWNTYGNFGKDVCWAVLDTGINESHPHFQKLRYTYLDIMDGTVIGRRNFTNDVDDDDHTGHGTHVAGIIAGESKGKVLIVREEEPLEEGGQPIKVTEEREVKIRGVAPWAKLISLKVLDRYEQTYASWVIKALHWIRKENDEYSEIRIHGANLSLGIPFEVDTYGCGHSPVCAEVNRLVNAGVVVCIAAGNRGTADLKARHSSGQVVLQRSTYQDVSIEDPGNAAEAITVGSTHKTKPHLYGVSYFSSKGPTGDGRLKPDLVAPGENIISCSHTFDTSSSYLYAIKSGTSMATPHVSGAIALLLSVKSEFQGYPRLVKEALLSNSVNLEREPYFQGKGLLDIFKAISGV